MWHPALADVSDHLPCFCTFSSNPAPCNQQSSYRDFSHFNQKNFTDGLKKVDFMSLVSQDVNESMNNIITTLQHLTDKHAPIKRASHAKKKAIEKTMDFQLHSRLN